MQVVGSGVLCTNEGFERDEWASTRNEFHADKHVYSHSPFSRPLLAPLTGAIVEMKPNIVLSLAGILVYLQRDLKRWICRHVIPCGAEDKATVRL